MGVSTNGQIQVVQVGRYADWLFFWKLALREAEAGKGGGDSKCHVLETN